MVWEMMMPIRFARLILNDYLKVAFWSVTFAWSVYFAPEIDLLIRPIVTGFKIDYTQSYRDGGNLFLSGEMRLARKGDPTLTQAQKDLEDRCEYAGISITESHRRKVPFWFDKPNEGPSLSESNDRENGYQPWGPWRLKIDLPEEVTSTTAVVRHECRMVWWFDTPRISIGKRGVSFAMERRVNAWIAESVLWNNLPVSRIRTLERPA